MKRSKKITPHLLIRARSRADDPVNFAIISLTPEWRELISYRLYTIEEFYTNKDFHCVSYWEAPLGFYYIPEQQVRDQGLMQAQEDLALVVLEPGELELFELPVNKLEAHQLLITKDGIAHYKAYAHGTGEAYWTAEFNLKRFIGESTKQSMQ